MNVANLGILNLHRETYRFEIDKSQFSANYFDVTRLLEWCVAKA